MHAIWERVLPFRYDFIEHRRHLTFGVWMVLVPRFRPNHMRKLEALIACSLGHFRRRLTLFVVLAAVRDCRAIREISHPSRTVVPVPKPLFVPSGLRKFILKNLQKFGRLRKACSRICCCPKSGKMYRKLPSSSTAHREPAHDHSRGVDTIMILGVF